MTLYVIPDLAFEIDDDTATAITPFGTVSCGKWIKMYFVRVAGQPVRGHCETLELAQSAANDWCKAKMAERLKVATVEELRVAIKEMEAPQ